MNAIASILHYLSNSAYKNPWFNLHFDTALYLIYRGQLAGHIVADHFKPKARFSVGCTEF
jgi:hypothetical protein